MDFWGALMLFFLIFLIMSCCGYCCTSKHRGAVLSTPVVVTTAQGPYQVTQIPPPAGFQNTFYSNHPGYPAQLPMNMPMPSTQPPMPGVQQHVLPYPPVPMPVGSNINPPSYDMAIAGGSAGQANPTLYEKQAAYNPNYAAH